MIKSKGLNVLSEVALTEAEQIKLATKRSKTRFHSSHASGSCDGVDTHSKVPDEQQQKTFSQDDEDAEEESDKDDDSKETKSDNDGDDLTHPNLSTYKAEDQDEEKADKEEMYSDQRVSTSPDYELTEEEEYKEDDDKDKEGEHEEEEDDLYSDLNINLERSDVEMTDAQSNQDTEDTHVTLTTVPRVFDQRVSTLESEMFEFRQTSQFAEAVSSILGFVDTYLTSKMKEAVDVAVQLQTNKLREEAQAENQEFLNQIDSTMKAIIKEQTSYAVVASLSKFELKKILIDKIKTNKSIDISNTQKNLYNALVESYNTDKDIITSYGDVVTLKRGRDDQDMDEDPSAGSNRGSKRRRSGKEAYKSAHVEEHDQKAANLEDQPQQEFNTGNEDESPVREALNEDVWHRNPSRPPTPDHWHNLKGKPYPHDLSKPLPLILNEQGRQVIPLDHFINDDLEYLKGGSSSQKYTTSITKTKAADYGQVKWVRDKVSRIWSPVKVIYDKHTYWGTYHWGPKHQKFYRYASNMETSKDVYSRHRRHRIIAVTSLKIMKWFSYSHLEEIIVRR
ncbi:hypothetical protein Tco_0828411 [Tanacetum coccineum]|uniref:Uncharacterized protein n=1 Tax=Tanacetum coccineum TaxID=301880 RepID=A0ABQ4XPQ6_9ASTR